MIALGGSNYARAYNEAGSRLASLMEAERNAKEAQKCSQRS